MPKRPTNTCADCGVVTFGIRCRPCNNVILRARRKIERDAVGPAWWVGKDRPAFYAALREREVLRQRADNAYSAPEYA